MLPIGAAWKPPSVAVTSYDAGLQRRRAVAARLVGDHVARDVRAVFLTTTVTPGSTAPVVSVTTPSILPVAAVCANAAAEQRENRQNYRGQQPKHLLHRDSLKRANHSCCYCSDGTGRKDDNHTGKLDEKTLENASTRVTQLPGQTGGGRLRLRNVFVKS